jgi:hypothetical protein
MRINRRPRAWPQVKNRAGLLSRGDIKRISVNDLERLAHQAKLRHWSGQGRPDWLHAHCEQLADLYLTYIQEEVGGCIRCSVTAILVDGSGGHFGVDVSPEDFDAFPDIGQADIVRLAHSYLQTYPHIPLDDAQREAWRQAYGDQ